MPALAWPGNPLANGVWSGWCSLNWEIPEFEWAFNPTNGKAATQVEQTIAEHQAEADALDSDVSSMLQWHTILSDTGLSIGGPSAIVACAKSFVRVVAHSGGVKKKVLALGNVCCKPLFRGKGYGQAMVAAALARLDTLEDVDHALFETAIPSFYTKMGAVQIEKHSVVNSTGVRHFVYRFGVLSASPDVRYAWCGWESRVATRTLPNADTGGPPVF